MEDSSILEIRKIRLLIVDDDPQIRRLIRLILETRFLISIIEAENGRKAIEKIEIDKPFLVVLDVMMPEMDGIEALKEIRRNPDWRELPVLICSAVNEREKILQLYNQGITDYIVKPINPTVFANKVIQYLKAYFEKQIKKIPVM